MDDLKALSAAASPGRLYVAQTGEPKPSEDEIDPPAFMLTGEINGGSRTVSTDPAYGGWNTDGGCSGYGLSAENAAFIVALWNAYRDGLLVEGGR